MTRSPDDPMQLRSRYLLVHDSKHHYFVIILEIEEQVRK